MSQPEFESANPVGVFVKKQKADIYTVLLVVALVALLLGCLFLYLEIREYGGFGRVRGPVAAVSVPLESSSVSLAWQQPTPAAEATFCSLGLNQANS